MKGTSQTPAQLEMGLLHSTLWEPVDPARARKDPAMARPSHGFLKVDHTCCVSVLHVGNTHPANSKKDLKQHRQ
jgi:hypothetical protein